MINIFLIINDVEQFIAKKMRILIVTSQKIHPQVSEKGIYAG